MPGSQDVDGFAARELMIGRLLEVCSRPIVHPVFDSQKPRLLQEIQL
jgi:hypothetical protein